VPQFRLTAAEEEQLKTQFEAWKNRLNWYVAGPVLGIAIAAIPLPDYRRLLSWLGVVVLLAAFVAAKNQFPAIFKELRDKNRTYKEDIIYRGIGSYYFSLKNSLRHFPMYMVAVILLTSNLFNVPAMFGL
jgi:hypothetical protein